MAKLILILLAFPAVSTAAINLACEYDMRDHLTSWSSPLMAKVVEQLTARRDRSECLGISNAPTALYDYTDRIAKKCDEMCKQFGNGKDSDIHFCLNECAKAKSNSYDQISAFFRGVGLCDGTGLVTEKKLQDIKTTK